MAETQRYALYQPQPSEEVDVNLHLNANWDKIDLAAKKTELDGKVTDLGVVDTSLQTQINAIKKSVFGDETKNESPACKISKTSNQTITKLTAEDVNFGGVSWESQPNMSDLNHNWILVPCDGLYVCTFQYFFDAAVQGIIRAYIYLNDAKRVSGKFPGEGTSPGHGGSAGIVTGIFRLESGTKVSAKIWHNSATNEVLGYVESGTYIAAAYIGEAPVP